MLQYTYSIRRTSIFAPHIDNIFALVSDYLKPRYKGKLPHRFELLVLTGIFAVENGQVAAPPFNQEGAAYCMTTSATILTITPASLA